MTSPPASHVDENTLLVLASGLDGDAAAVARDWPASLDWRYVRRAAERQGVAPLLYAWLQRHPEVNAPEETRRALHDLYWSCHFRNRLLFEELQRIVQSAAEVGVVVLPLKGAHLAPRFYPSPALRPVSDLDLLIRPDDAGRLAGILRARGYVELQQAPSYVEESNLDIESRDYCWFASLDGVDALVEFRTAPLEPTVGRLTDLDIDYTARLHAHAETVWARAMSSPSGIAPALTPEDVLLHVTTHLAAKHLDFRLIWLHDIGRLLLAGPPIDWPYVMDAAQRLRVLAPVLAALEAASRWTGVPVPERVLADGLERMGPSRPWSLVHRDLRRLRAHVASLAECDLTADGPAVWPIGAALSRVRGWRARFGVLRWVALPDRAYLRHRGIETGGLPDRLVGSLRRLRLRARWRGRDRQR